MFKVGQKIIVKHEDSDLKAQAIVNDIDSFEFEFTVDNDATDFIVSLLDRLSLIFECNQKVFTSICEVTMIRQANPIVCQAKIVGVVRTQNRRKNERFIVNNFCEVISEVTGETSYGMIEDVSLSGMKLVTEKEFQIDDEVSVRMEIPEKEGRDVLLRSKIKRKKISGNYKEFSLEILEKDNEDNEKYKNYISKLKEQN